MCNGNCKCGGLCPLQKGDNVTSNKKELPPVGGESGYSFVFMDSVRHNGETLAALKNIDPSAVFFAGDFPYSGNESSHTLFYESEAWKGYVEAIGKLDTKKHRAAIDDLQADGIYLGSISCALKAMGQKLERLDPSAYENAMAKERPQCK